MNIFSKLIQNSIENIQANNIAQKYIDVIVGIILDCETGSFYSTSHSNNNYSHTSHRHNELIKIDGGSSNSINALLRRCPAKAVNLILNSNILLNVDVRNFESTKKFKPNDNLFTVPSIPFLSNNNLNSFTTTIPLLAAFSGNSELVKTLKLIDPDLNPKINYKSTFGHWVIDENCKIQKIKPPKNVGMWTMALLSGNSETMQVVSEIFKPVSKEEIEFCLLNANTLMLDILLVAREKLDLNTHLKPSKLITKSSNSL